MKHLRLKYDTTITKQFVNGKVLALVINTITKEGYIISNYSSLKTAGDLAPRAYKVMLKHPSKQFKAFINKTK